MSDRNRKKEFRNNIKDTRGDAMIVVVCLMFLFTALSLAMLLSVSAVTGSLKKNAALTRCHLAAESFSEMMGKDLTDSTKVTEFQTNIRDLLLSDADFNFCWHKEKEGRVWEFQPKSESGMTVGETIRGYDITVTIYFGDVSNMEKEDADRRKVSQTESGKFGDLFLYTVVTCSKGNDSYHIRQKYQMIIIGEPGEEEHKWIFVKA